MRLVAGHGGGGVIEHDEREFRLVVNGVDDAGQGGGKERGIADEGKAGAVRFEMADALGDAETRAHAQAGIHHVQRHGVAQRVAADIPAEDGFAAFHGLLDGIEGGAVRTAGTQHGRTHRQRRRRFLRDGRELYAEEGGHRGGHAVPRVLTGTRNVPGLLAENLYGKAVFPA